MLNLYSDPEGKRIFEKSNPATAHRPTSSSGILTQSGSDGEKAIGNAEEVLKEKDKRISELERELTLIKVRKEGHTDSFEFPKMELCCIQGFGIEWFNCCNMDYVRLAE